MLYSFYAQARLLERETVVFCAGTCLCNISHEFLCLPHCCRFLQYPPTSLKKKGERGAKKINHCTDCCKTSEWIWAIFFFFFCVSACVKEMRVPPPRCVPCMQSGFFLLLFFLFDFTQIIDNRNFGGNLMEIPQCTWLPVETTAAKLTVRNRWRVQARTQKWPL